MFSDQYFSFSHICFEKLISSRGELWCLMVLYILQVPLHPTGVWLFFITEYVTKATSLLTQEIHLLWPGVWCKSLIFSSLSHLMLLLSATRTQRWTRGLAPINILRYLSIRLAIHLCIFLPNAWSASITVFSWVVFFFVDHYAQIWVRIFPCESLYQHRCG